MPGPVALLNGALQNPHVERGFRPVGDRLFGTLEVRRVIDRPLTPAGRHLVSVVMPSYGYGRFIEAAIDSAARQEGVDVEVVVVDDCGPDDSLARAEQAARRYPEGRVRVLRNERNLGHTRTFAHGLREARGEFVNRLDADDVLLPGALARAVAVLEQVPSVSLAYGEVFDFAHDPTPPHRARPERAVVYSGHDWFRRCLVQGRNLVSTPTGVMRRSTMDAIGGWRVDLPHSQDLEYWLRLAAVGDVARIEGVYHAAKRDHADNMSNTVGMVGLMYYSAHVEGLDALMESVGDRFPDADALRRQALTALADEAVGDICHGIDTGAMDAKTRAQLADFVRTHGSPSAQRTLARALAEGSERDPRVVLRAKRTALGIPLRYAHWRATGL